MELKIIDKRHVTFRDLKIGQMFVAVTTGDIYIKINKHSNDNNCVRVENNELMECPLGLEVIIPVRVKVEV